MNDISIEELREIVEEVLGEPSFAHSTSGSGWYAYNCPECAKDNCGVPDNKYNFTVSYEKNYYHCWKCETYNDTKGNLYYLGKKYIKKVNQKKYNTILKDVDFITNPDLVEKSLELPKEFRTFTKQISKESAPFFNYLKRRGLSLENILKYKLGYCLSGRYKDRVIIPSYDINGKIEMFTSRTIIPNFKPTYLEEPDLNKNKHIFFDSLIKWDCTVYIVEGVFDAMCIPNAIPLMGKKISSHLLENIVKNLKSDLVVILDKDVLEVELLETLTTLKSLIRKNDLYYVSLESKDVSESFMKGGYNNLIREIKKGLQRW